MEFYGQAGVGKTTLLRHLFYHPVATSFPDSVIYLSARHQPVDDLLQSLFDAFYESDVPFKPTDVEIRHALQDKQALILLDDVDLARDEVETLMDAAPGCTFLLASLERHLWAEGRALALHGLPTDDAPALVKRELGRPLSPEEETAAQGLCTTLGCHPLHLLQTAAMAREEDRSLTEVARQLQTPSPAEALTAEMLNSLQEPERQVMAVLAALGGAPLHADHLAALTRLANAAPVLETLMRRGLVQAHSPRYSLAGALGEYLQQMWDLTPWAERALAYFTTWAEEQRQTPAHLLEEADAILQTLEWATGTGRWKEVLRLGWAVEGALALGRRWGAWAQVLQRTLQAARALGDQAAEAWSLHQLGSRALCLGDAAAARTSLSQALRIREALGDRAGAAVTRHNMGLLPGVPPAPPRKPPAPKAGPSPAAWLALAAGAVIAISLLVGIVVVIMRPTPTPPPATPKPTLPPITTATSTSTPAAAPTGTSTLTATPTNTPIPTATPTGTPPPTATPTNTPTSTATPTGIPTSTSTPTNTLTPTPTPTATSCIPARVSLQPEGEISLVQGECITLRWDVEYATAVYLNGEGVVGHDAQKVCPASTTTYHLHVEAPCGNVDKSLKVNVTTPPDTKGPDISGLKTIQEIRNKCSCPPCQTDVDVNVADPSGVAEVTLFYKKPGETTWRTKLMTNVGGASYRTTLNAQGWTPGTLQFRVRASDNRGNSSTSELRTITISTCPID